MTEKHLHHLSFAALFLTTLFLVMFVCSDGLHAFDYVTGTGTYPFDSQPQPAQRASIIDRNFHTTITRITNAAVDALTAPAPVGNYEFGLYDMHSALNCDDTYMILCADNYFLWGGPKHPTRPLQLIRTLPLMGQSYVAANAPCYVYTDQTPIWDSSDPNVFYFLMRREAQGRPDTCPSSQYHGPKMWKYNVATNTVSLVHDFSTDPTTANWFRNQKMPNGQAGVGYYYIDWEEYNKPSKDRRYWAISIYFYDTASFAQWMACCVYDKTLDQVIAYTEDSNVFYKGYNKGYHEISPSGTRIIVRTQPYMQSNTYAVCDMRYNILFKFRSGHMDVATDVNGHDVVFGQLFAYSDGSDYFSWIDCTDGTVYGAVENWNIARAGMHCSANQYTKPGWVFINTYGVAGYWNSDQIFAVQLDPSKAFWKVPWMPRQGNGNDRVMIRSSGPLIWRIAFHHVPTETCTVPSGYLNQAHGGISLSGNYFVYAGAWETCQSPGSNDQIDAYMITLPPTWWEDFRGNIRYQSDTTPPAPPTGLRILR